MRNARSGDTSFVVDEGGYIRYQGRVWLVNDEKIKNEMLAKFRS